jgi:dTDP-4-amino-4,6-dideoxygalactose transaminase
MEDKLRATSPGRAAVEELAVFTGRPAFQEPLHVGTPNVGDQEAFLERTRDILQRRRFTNDGSYVREFERRVAELAAVEHCVATCNGTVALQLVASATRLTGEVVVPSFTFVATAHAFQWQGLTPVFCDIDEKTHNLDPSHVAELITDRTSAIVGVHVWGRPAYSDELADLARSRGLHLLFDAAHALGCSYEQRPIGGGGEAEILSFHATKIVNTFEGGAVLTNDGELADRLRSMRNFGFVDYDDVQGLGVNGKMSEIAAAMGLTTLESLDDFVCANRRNYDQYRVELDAVPGLSVIPYDETERQNCQYVVVEIDTELCSVPRDNLLRILHAENVLARRYFYPGCHRMEPYRTLAPALSLPVTEHVASRILILPTGSAVAQEDITTICQILSLAVNNPEALPTHLSAAPRA